MKELITKEKIKQRHDDRMIWKKQGLMVLKKHYFKLVALVLIAAILGTTYSDSLSGLSTLKYGTTEQSSDQLGVPRTLSHYLIHIYSTAKEEESSSQPNQDKTVGFLEIGRSEGVFAKFVNDVETGEIVLPLQRVCTHIAKSENYGTMISIGLSFLMIVLIWVFVSKIYKVIFRRIFLEARIYDKIPFDRLTYLVRVKQWIHTSITVAIVTLLESFFQITVIGYYKKYEYLAIPYILAENPKLTVKQSIHLSRNMMRNHKWEAFMLQLSFALWAILGSLTFGFTELVFSNAYRETVWAEYYVKIRELANQNQVEGIELLNDRYLFEQATPEVINEAYTDIIERIKEPENEIVKRNGFSQFLESYLGFVFYRDKREKEYRKNELIKLEKESYLSTIELKSYPRRLNPFHESDQQQFISYTEYYRHYSITSIILLFFVVSFIGWSWEVALHLVEDGVFVNRGVLTGPWLPIYGSGATIIILLLYRFRDHPLGLFTSTIFVCGIVEYFTSYYLEITHNGLRWWDYSGYFLNINGRICAEGLLVFGVGAFFIVYVLAPLLDNLFVKINRKLKVVICIILLFTFSVDLIYSKTNPNTGAGITDYSNYLEKDE